MFLDEDYSFTTEGWSWVILDAAGGENELSDVALYRTGEPYGTLPKCTRDGFYFAGWKTPDGTVLNATDTVAGNLRLTAVWSASPVPETGMEPEMGAEQETDQGVLGVSVTVFSDVPAGAWYVLDSGTLVRMASFFSGISEANANKAT